jgi:serine/threonine protein kinase
VRGMTDDAEGLGGVTCRGTMGYMAPEMFTSPESTGTAADVYSAAITLIVMLSGEKPCKHSLPEVSHYVLPVRCPDETWFDLIVILRSYIKQ